MIIGPGLPEDYEQASHAGATGGDRLPCREAHVLKGHDGPVFAVRFNKTGTYCVSCGKVREGGTCLMCAMWLRHPLGPPCPGESTSMLYAAADIPMSRCGTMPCPNMPAWSLY